MSEIFLSVLNMSISASWVCVVVFLMRLVLKKAPKWLTVLLWAIVALRLVVPFAIESDLSLIPSAQTVSPAIMTDNAPQIYTGFASVNNAVNPIIDASFSPQMDASANPLQILIPICALIWLIGVAAMLAYSAISYIKLKRKLLTAILLREGIYQSDIASPFVLGFFRPKIYLPFDMDEQDMLHVIAHERSHIRRRDHWWKPIGFVLLALHWFNPIMWMSYVFLCRDIELACDESVAKDLTADERADYSQALLHCSISRRMIAFCPLAFGEVSVKSRVKSVLRYKKPTFWILAASAILISVVMICFLTNPSPARMTSIEFISVSERVDNTTAVWITDGMNYQSVGAVDTSLLRELADLKISKDEISLSRDEDRDQTHTIVLQNQEDVKPQHSYVQGLYIHFNTDFTAVWANNGVKPTLSYRVIEPEMAREVFEHITNYNISVSATIDIQSLRDRFPMYFDLGTFKGLEIYIWQMAENSYSCVALPGKNMNYTWDQILALQENTASLDEMRAIVQSYIADGLATKDDIILLPITMPHSSYAYRIDDAYRQQLEELFWYGAQTVDTVNGNFRTYYRMSNDLWRYGEYLYKYRLEITGRMPNAVVDTTYVYLSNIENISFSRAMMASGISSNIGAYFSEDEAVLVDFWNTEDPEPTGYPTGEIQQPQIRYNGKVYFYFATGFDEELPKGFLHVGVIDTVDNINAPEKDYCGARVEVGQSICANAGEPGTIYVKYESGYAKFTVKE